MPYNNVLRSLPGREVDKFEKSILAILIGHSALAGYMIGIGVLQDGTYYPAIYILGKELFRFIK